MTVESGRLFRKVALIILAAYAALAALFVVGETFTDPGGWEAVGLVSLWVVPLVALSAIAWRWPQQGTVILGVLTAGIVVLSVWFAVDHVGWRSFEDEVGPVRAIASFVMMVALAVLGWKRPTAAGWQLLVVGVVPVLVAGLGAGRAAGIVSLTALSWPAVAMGALYLLSDRTPRRDAASRPGQAPVSSGSAPTPLRR